MASYDPYDLVTYYFVIIDDGPATRIQAWTDNKVLAECYMELHNCKLYHLKKVTKTVEEIGKILEENLHDEIKLYNILVKNPDSHKKGNDMRTVVIPSTETEQNFISDEANTFCSSMVDYGYLNGVYPYLKKKYQQVLDDLFLDDVIKKVVHNKSSKFTQSVSFDHMMILFRLMPDHFGK